ncbi:hypothetical protein HPULCUR_008631 [Helicostylum pulchrum]|uniref:Uncharacterized protein n=1 Tax=Helicostylum pulchrum TaxID=562976 RepID=A0ABP9Y8S1_9FUNG
MPNITINVRPSTGQLFQVDLDSDSTTVEALKQLIAEKMGNVEATNLKLVFSGRILKNEDLCSQCKLATGCTVHVVRSGVNKTPANTAPTTPKTSNATTPTPVAYSDPIPPIPPTPSPSTLTGLGAASPFGDMQMPNMDPEVMRQMMDSPFMQNIMGNTDFVRSIIMSNPQMKALVEQNPELGHVISDPAFLRQSMEMMRNPELMREMQRNNDRALSNIEAIPGGFNHLRRMYNSVQGPMESAMGNNGTGSSDEANERLARELNVESVPENSLNTQALPNPWAAAPASNTSNNNNSNTSPANPFAAAAANGNGSENPLAALLGGGGGGGSMFPFGQPQSPTQPVQQQQQPQQQAGATPFWADPNFIQASMRMQQMMANNNNNTNNNNTSTALPQENSQQNLLQQMMMGFPSGGFGGLPDFGAQQQPQQQPVTPSEPPEVRFRDQLAQLEEMGFSEKPANVRALLATGGNVQAAIEYLLQ